MKRSDWLLALLYSPGFTTQRNEPLDRIRIMKALFTLGKESEEELPDFYEFVPYLYGPCSFDVYADLDELRHSGHISVEPVQPINWSRYRLTTNGVREAERIFEQLSSSRRQRLEEAKKLVTGLSLLDLLRHVYRKYPESATASVINIS